jgi:DNA-binding winged helix-turn-helix (wHTH) protein
VLIHFGEFALDPERRELFRHDRALHLQPKAFELLALLVEQRSRVVSKDEIRRHLWPGRSAPDSSLARVVSELRATLGDETRRPRIVRTVHSIGYTLLDEGAEPEKRPTKRPWCRLAWGSRRIALVEGENAIGRASDGLVVIDSTRVSRLHARIVVVDGRATLEDLGSKNGTFVDGRRLEAPLELRDGDEIEVGPARLLFELRGGDLDTTSAD